MKTQIEHSTGDTVRCLSTNDVQRTLFAERRVIRHEAQFEGGPAPPHGRVAGLMGAGEAGAECGRL